MGCKPPVSLWRCGAEPGAIPALAFLRERFSFHAIYVAIGIDIRAIYVILNANIPPDGIGNRNSTILVVRFPQNWKLALTGNVEKW